MHKTLTSKCLTAVLVVALLVPVGAMAAATTVTDPTNLLVNPGAEYGSTSRWVRSTAPEAAAEVDLAEGTVEPRSGSNFFAFTGTEAEDAFLEQKISLTGREGATFSAGGWIQTEAETEKEEPEAEDNDYGTLVLSFLDKEGAVIEEITSGAIGHPGPGAGSEGYAGFDLTDLVPAGTVEVMFRLEGYRVEGDRIDVFWDDLYFKLTKTAPAAGDAAAVTPKDTAVVVELPVTDAEGDELSLAIVDAPEHGSLSAFDGMKVTYTPDSDFSGTDRFTYEASDGELVSETATVRLTVLTTTGEPVAKDGAVTVEQDSKDNAIKLKAEDPMEKELTYAITDGPDHGTLTRVSEGKYRYTPAAGYAGKDGFAFQASNGTLSSNIAKVTITVRPPASATAKVTWLAPLAKGGIVLKNHRSIPIKFKLHSEDGTIVQGSDELSLTVYAPAASGTGRGKVIASWSGRALAKVCGGYAVIFHAKGYELPDGVYTLVVSDAGTELGELKLTMAAKAAEVKDKERKEDKDKDWKEDKGKDCGDDKDDDRNDDDEDRKKSGGKYTNVKHKVQLARRIVQAWSKHRK